MSDIHHCSISIDRVSCHHREHSIDPGVQLETYFPDYTPRRPVNIEGSITTSQGVGESTVMHTASVITLVQNYTVRSKLRETDTQPT